MKSWKTTITGMLVIFASVGNAVAQYLENNTMPDFAILFPTVLTGLGLILGKDFNVTHVTEGEEK